MMIRTQTHRKRLTAILLAIAMTLPVLVPLSLIGADALQAGTQYPMGEILTGSDFSELADLSTLLDPSAEHTAIKNADGDSYLTFYHPSETDYSLANDGDNTFIRASQFHNTAGELRSAISFSLVGKTDGITDFVTDAAVRYPDFISRDTPTVVDLISLRGTYKGAGAYFSPVRLGTDETIIYYDGNGYADSGVMLTEHQWKNISVAWHFSGASVTADIYINENLMVQGVRIPAGFDTVESAEALNYVCGRTQRSVRTDLDYFWVYEGKEPEFGLYPEADPSEINAELDFSVLEDGKIYTESIKNDAFSFSPLGNMFQILSSGNNKYLAVNHTAYRPNADIYSRKPTIGKSQVLEAAVRLGSSWNGEAALLSPFSTDESGITNRIELITVDRDGNIRLKSNGELIGSVGRDVYTVISIAISFDRTSFDVYIDGRAAVSGGELPSGLDKIDGVRLFSIDSVSASAGSMYIDYGVMYSGAVPVSAEESTKIYYENTFNSGDLSDISPLRAENSEAVLKNTGNGYRLTYSSAAAGKASLHLDTERGNAPLYIEFVFSYTRIVSDIDLVTFTKDGEGIYTAVSVGSDGTIYTVSGTDRRTGVQLISGKSYRITVIGNAENGYASVYVNGEPEICYNNADNIADADGVRLMSTERLGSSEIYLDDLTVYRSFRKLGASVAEPEISFTAQTTQIGDILVEWESAGPAAKYTVWRSTSKLAPQTKVCELTGELSFTDINVTENKTYYYTVCVTYLREGKEYYHGYGEKLLEITAVLPPEPEKPVTPAGQLPSYTSITVLSDDFSGESTKLRLGSEKCYIEKSSQTLKLINGADSMDIPYFAMEAVGARRAAIFDFTFTVNKNTVSINLASVYSEAKKVTDLIKLSDGKLMQDDGTVLCTLKNEKSYRLTVWIDAQTEAAAVFIDGECLDPYIEIPYFAKLDNSYAVRFCSAIGEASVSVDDFKYLETRAFISDYTANPLAPHAAAHTDRNSIMWNDVNGCKYFTLWSCSSPEGKYMVLADGLNSNSYTDSGVTANRYYKVTYTFDSLGVELTIPLSGMAAAERSAGAMDSFSPFLDFGNTATLYTFIISLVGLLAIIAVMIPHPFPKKKKKEEAAETAENEAGNTK